MMQIEVDAMRAMIHGMREIEEIPVLLDRIARALEEQNRILAERNKDV